MTYTVSFNRQFAIEFSRYPVDQQDKITDFITLYSKIGLSDFSKYTGKISPSWSGLNYLDPNYSYAFNNELWHYHIGVPIYISTHPKYKTSDWILHFQWINKGNRIDIVDVCYHYKSTGEFYIPVANYLIK